MADFPASLIINRAGYSATLSGSAYTYDDQSIFEQRIDYDTGVFTMPLTVRTNRAGLAVFNSFYENDIFNGSGSFNAMLDIGDGVQSYPVKISSDVTFDGSGDPRWQINFSVTGEFIRLFGDPP